MCQFDHNLLIDTILGFYQCEEADFKSEFFQITSEYCMKAGLAATHDAKTTVRTSATDHHQQRSRIATTADVGCADRKNAEADSTKQEQTLSYCLFNGDKHSASTAFSQWLAGRRESMGTRGTNMHVLW